VRSYTLMHSASTAGRIRKMVRCGSQLTMRPV
jgi:hypothetical protein